MDTATTNPLSPGAHTVDVDGIAQRYHVAGAGPVCVVHPGGPGFSWQYLRMPAVEQHLTTVYVEPIGTCASGRLATHPHGYTLDRYVQALNGVIDHLGVAKVHLLGHSHGGSVVQEYALEYPDRLAGMILYGSAPAVAPEQPGDGIGSTWTKNADNSGLSDSVESSRSSPMISPDTGFAVAARRLFPNYFADQRSRAEQFTPAPVPGGGFHTFGLDDCLPVAVDYRDRLGSIKTPTLGVLSRHDFICGSRWACEIHERTTDAALVVLDNSGPFAHIEEPDTFARAVVDFVASTPA